MTGSIRTALALPGARAVAAWSVLGRFGFAMVNVSLLLLVEAESGSYAVAGAVSAASLVGTAAGVVVQSRLLDRHGPARILLAFAGPHAVLSGAVLVLVPRGLPTPAVAVLVAAQCAVLPMVQVASRAMWTHLAPAGRLRDAAYSYEAVSFELCWLLGPALAAVLATWLWPGSALLMALTLATVSAVGFALTAAVRSRPGRGSSPPQDWDRCPDGVAGDQSAEGAGLAVLLVATTAFGLTIGLVVVSVMAGAEANGVPQLAGVLLALWSTSAVLSGTAYQRSPWPRRVAVRLPVLMAAFGTVLVIPAFLDGVLPITVALVLAGATVVPQIALHNTLLDGLVPQRRLASAFGWLTTAILVSSAGGQALGGYVVQGHDHQAAFLTAAVSANLLATVVWLGRRRLPVTGPGRQVPAQHT